MTQQLLDELKKHLRVTWDEEDLSLISIIEGSEDYFRNLTGTTFDFTREVWVKDLLLNRCRYIYNNAGDEFEKNYKLELSRLILMVAIGKVGVINETSP